MNRTYNYVSVPYFRAPNGGLVAGDIKDAPNSRIAECLAETFVGRQAIVVNRRQPVAAAVVTYIGVVAFAQVTDAEAPESSEHTILARFGKTPESVEGFA